MTRRNNQADVTVPEQSSAGPIQTRAPVLVISCRELSRVVPLSPGQKLVVGRDDSADVSLDSSTLSRRHAAFMLEADGVWVEDLESTNQTKVNGRPVTRLKLRHGDEVALGEAVVSLHGTSAKRRDVLDAEKLLSTLKEELERAQVLRRDLSIVLINDAGTQVLDTVREHLRSADAIGLIDDSRVLLVLPELGSTTATPFVKAFAPGVRFGCAAYPADGATVEALLEAVKRSMQNTGPSRATPPLQKSAVVFASAAMKDVVSRLERVAKSAMPVMLRGETGSGKEVLARYLHQISERTTRPMVAVNCGAIPATLIESVLFGHERGAFTGAATSTAGIFEQANGGTVLLDEVGELSPQAQAALLRVLETKEVRRVGGNKEIAVDVRVISATHRDLDGMVKAGTFREDLLYRLNAMQFEVPPLRQRLEELPALIAQFIEQANAAHGRWVTGVEPEAQEVMQRYQWPGNLRELRNAIDHAVVLCGSAKLAVADLPRRIREANAVGTVAIASATPLKSSADLRNDLDGYEKQMLLDALKAAGGNRTEAARRLGIPVRTLSYKLKRHDIKKLGFGSSEDE